MGHPRFDYRPIMKRPRVSLWVRRQARLARDNGYYNLNTLRLFRLTWQLSGRLGDLAAYLGFRRDLGYTLTPARTPGLRSTVKVPNWQARLLGLSAYRQRQLKNLITETASPLRAPETAPQFQCVVDRWFALRDSWWSTLREQLQTAKDIAVVGNSPLLDGQNLGASIDEHGLVVRFNHCFSGHTQSADIGTKTSIWVMAPGYQGEQPHRGCTLVTGPAMLSRQQHWAQLATHEGPVLDVPLSSWQALVRIFGAPPPSAGALLLHWLRQHTPAPLDLYGFGFINETGSRYHLADPDHQPVQRHNWSAEADWLREEFRQT